MRGLVITIAILQLALLLSHPAAAIGAQQCTPTTVGGSYACAGAGACCGAGGSFRAGGGFRIVAMDRVVGFAFAASTAEPTFVGYCESDPTGIPPPCFILTPPDPCNVSFGGTPPPCRMIPGLIP